MDKRPIVYVPQIPTRRNKQTGEFEATIDLTPASAYGEIVVLLPPGKVMLSPAPWVQKLKQKMKDFSDDDYIVSCGDPNAFSAATCVAHDNNRGRYKTLIWDGRQRRYIATQINIRS